MGKKKKTMKEEKRRKEKEENRIKYGWELEENDSFEVKSGAGEKGCNYKGQKRRFDPEIGSFWSK